MPGFQVGLVFVALAMWGQGDVSVEAGGDRGGEDVPEVERDDVGGHEIDLVLGSWLNFQFGSAPRRAIYCLAKARHRAARQILHGAKRKIAPFRMTSLWGGRWQR